MTERNYNSHYKSPCFPTGKGYAHNRCITTCQPCGIVCPQVVREISSDTAEGCRDAQALTIRKSGADRSPDLWITGQSRSGQISPLAFQKAGPNAGTHTLHHSPASGPQSRHAQDGEGGERSDLDQTSSRHHLTMPAYDAAASTDASITATTNNANVTAPKIFEGEGAAIIIPALVSVSAYRGTSSCVQYRQWRSHRRLKATVQADGAPTKWSGMFSPTSRERYGRRTRHQILLQRLTAKCAPLSGISKEVAIGRAMPSPPSSLKFSTGTAFAISASPRGSKFQSCGACPPVTASAVIRTVGVIRSSKRGCDNDPCSQGSRSPQVFSSGVGPGIHQPRSNDQGRARDRAMCPAGSRSSFCNQGCTTADYCWHYGCPFARGES